MLYFESIRKRDRIRWIILATLLLFIGEGCALFDWRCTKGGNWSSYYDSGDPRCHGFCADTEQKYCGRTPEEAEALQMEKDPAFNTAREQMEKERANKERELLAADRIFCQSLGFKEGSEGLANCLLTRYRDHQAEFNDRQRQLKAERQKEIEEMQRARQAIINTLTPTRCTTINGSIISSTTCY